MNKINNISLKTFASLIVLSSVSASHNSQCMDNKINNSITVINENNDPQSLLQVNYQQAEIIPSSKSLNKYNLVGVKYNLVGMNDLISSRSLLYCLVTNHKKRASIFLSDPSSKEKSIELRIRDKDIIKIHAKDDNVIFISKNDEHVYSLSYD